MVLNGFENVDILDSLKQIMELHTKHYKEDFDIDVKIIRKMAVSENPEHRHLVWLSRPNGTHCLRERDLYLRDSHENKVFRFYREQTNNPVLAYALTLKEKDGPAITGDIHQLDYPAEVERVKLLTCPIHRAVLTFADGSEFTVPYANTRGSIHKLSVKHGEIRSIGYEPESPSELKNRSVCRRLHEAKDNAAAAPDRKPPHKREPSL